MNSEPAQSTIDYYEQFAEDFEKIPLGEALLGQAMKKTFAIYVLSTN